MQKTKSRLRRAKKTRRKIRELGAKRLTVFKSSKHIYAQIFDENMERVIVSASSLEKDVRTKLQNTGNCQAASAVGQLVAERAKESGVEKVAFDRAGFKFHGRVKALADSARESGLSF
jgi:large subunit ribosomal protein L18